MVGTNPTDFLLSKAPFLHSLQSLIVVKTGIRDEGGTETELDMDLVRSTGNLIVDHAWQSSTAHMNLNPALGTISTYLKYSSTQHTSTAARNIRIG
jgi:hypothetical protein